ncbi:hypothetical protein DESPIG_00643 [Desulfovibrio piger ATCC 29098]|uniref:Uncharacterized protein n=1 Tax=Desulfovibrio piger ATCC 29098 TaxID=411464 RepID=B6WRF3_9BACT|nr:hypothetical protein DESPIG_00643 [Desulfovibrio piger ATCC 29098]
MPFSQTASSGRRHRTKQALCHNRYRGRFVLFNMLELLIKNYF